MKSILIITFIHCPDVIKNVTIDNGNEFALYDKISN
jgi:IS30 family transposase